MSVLLFILVIIGVNQAVEAAPDYQDLPNIDPIVQFELQQLLSSDFLYHFGRVSQFAQESSQNPIPQEYDETIWEMKQIAENIPFQTFLNRLQVLKAARAARGSELALRNLLSNEYAVLSKHRAKLIGKLMKLRTNYDLVMYQHDTIQRELDHISATNNKIKALKEERKSKLASVVSLRNQIRYSELLITYQDSLLAEHRDANAQETAADIMEDNSDLEWKTNFSEEELPFDVIKSWRTDDSSTFKASNQDDSLVITHSNVDEQESHGNVDLQDASVVTSGQRLNKTRAQRSSRSRSISSELSSIYKLEFIDKDSESEENPRKKRMSFRRTSNTKHNKASKGSFKLNRLSEEKSQQPVSNQETIGLLSEEQPENDQSDPNLKSIGYFADFVTKAKRPEKKFSWKLVHSWFQSKSGPI